MKTSQNKLSYLCRRLVELKSLLMVNPFVGRKGRQGKLSNVNHSVEDYLVFPSYRQRLWRARAPP